MMHQSWRVQQLSAINRMLLRPIWRNTCVRCGMATSNVLNEKDKDLDRPKYSTEIHIPINEYEPRPDEIYVVGENREITSFFEFKGHFTLKSALIQLQKTRYPWKRQLYMRKRKEYLINEEQTFSHIVVGKYGYDLSAAHSIIDLDGKVCFKGAHNTWLDKTSKNDLPDFYVAELKVQSIDVSGTNIMYGGFDCLMGLEHLNTLNIANCKYVDDYCMDRICGLFSDTLEEFDISGCKKITSIGFILLARLSKLKRLKMADMDSLPNLQLLCLMLLESLPGLEIIGYDYLREPELTEELPASSEKTSEEIASEIPTEDTFIQLPHSRILKENESLDLLQKKQNKI